MQNFRVLHEIGHAAEASILVLQKKRFLSLFFLPLGAWLVFQFGMSAPPYVNWVYAGVLSLLLLSEYPRQIITDTLLEQMADHFSLTCLSHSDRIQFAKYMLARFPRSWPVDKRHQILNTERIFNLKQKLELINEHADEELLFTFRAPRYGLVWWLGPAFFTFLAAYTTVIDWDTFTLLFFYFVLLAITTAVFWVLCEWYRRKALGLEMMKWLKMEVT